MGPQLLSRSQAAALFNILTHLETYAEIEKFKYPGALVNYGAPFKSDTREPHSSPILQALVAVFVLKLPGLRNINSDFWQVRCQSVVEELGAAGLSESYDKGSLTLRKSLATACAAVLEAVGRAVYGGLPRSRKGQNGPEDYDYTNSESVAKAWEDFIQQAVYGNLIDDLFSKAAETDKLEEHNSLVQAAHEYILVNLAAFLYHVFMISPDGQSLLRILENVQKLVPYGMIRQALRVGNAATMINGITKLLLAKLSVTAWTNWIGISNSVDEGMNMLQHIVSTVISWDISELEKRCAKMQNGPDSLTIEQRQAIEEYVKLDRRKQDIRRQKSESMARSIVAVIFEDATISTDMSDSQHSQALAFLSLCLSINDRKELLRILCHPQPDHISQGIREIVSAYDPIIRAVHNSYDLSSGLSDFENFLNDLIKVCKRGLKSNAKTSGLPEKEPAIEDFVKLLKRHQASSHRFLHEVAKNNKDVTTIYRKYAHDVVTELKARHTSEQEEAGAGDLTAALNGLLSHVSDGDRQEIMSVVDAHADYLSAISAFSSAHLHSIISNTNRTTAAPGMYLASWQSLLDSTPISPNSVEGPVRYGSSEDIRDASRVDINGELKRPLDQDKAGENELPKPPDTSLIARLLLELFKQVLVDARA